MTKTELIAQLEEIEGDPEITIWDAEFDEAMTLRGIYRKTHNDDREVILSLVDGIPNELRYLEADTLWEEP